jgi:hypothetical protein
MIDFAVIKMIEGLDGTVGREWRDREDVKKLQKGPKD